MEIATVFSGTKFPTIQAVQILLKRCFIVEVACDILQRPFDLTFKFVYSHTSFCKMQLCEFRDSEAVNLSTVLCCVAGTRLILCFTVIPLQALQKGQEILKKNNKHFAQ